MGMLELKYEYFPATWPGRIKLLELIFAFFCMVCSAPAYEGSQHWFLFVVVVAFIGSIFFSLYSLCLAEPLNKLQVHWLMVEFWFTAIAAFIAMLADFAGVENDLYQYWIDANVAAGVFGLFNTVVYGAGAYLIYIDWKANPTGATAPPPPA